jgi:hypothetical protein
MYRKLRDLLLPLPLLALGLDPGSARATELPEQLQALAPDARWSRTGEARLRKFLIHIYDAELWSAGPRWSPDAPYALAITYARDIGSDELVARTQAELERMGRWDAADEARWRDELERAFPDVRPGDRLVGVHLPGQPLRFYYNGKLYSEIQEPRLARVFFGLWLDPHTSEPEMRRRLLGGR